MRFVILGLSLSSSWENSRAGQYRALLGTLASRGHHILFLEREDAADHARRDLVDPHWCQLRFYRNVADLRSCLPEMAAADVVVLGSDVAELDAIAPVIRRAASRMTVFLDMDRPNASERIGAERFNQLLRMFDLYLSSCAGLSPRRIEEQYAIPALAFTPWVDLAMHRPVEAERRWDLGFLGRTHADRHTLVERLLIEPARRMPKRRFVVAGSDFPDGIRWPANVERIEHVPTEHQAGFYSSLGWALSLARPAAAAVGWSPAPGVLEAAACGTPVITNGWRGLSAMFVAGTELLVATGADDVVAALGRTPAMHDAIARAGRARVRMAHSSAHRASVLEAAVAAFSAAARRRVGRGQPRKGP